MQYGEFISLMKDERISVFTVNDASKILGKSRAYTSKFLSGRSDIESVEKGRYCLKGTSEDVVASHVTYPSYLSMISSLRFHNLTTQLPAIKYVVTTVQHKPLPFHKYRIVFIKAKKKLLFGFGSVNGVVVATPEKAFIDAFYIKKRMLYEEEFDAGMRYGKVDVGKLKKYAVALKDRNLISRLGHFLEGRYGINCDDLLTYRSGRYIRFSSVGRLKDERWRVIYDG